MRFRFKQTPEYRTWANLKGRCTNPNLPGYKDYGGRGISVCERWQKFENFYADMGEKPSGMTLERKDNNGNYEPDNCKWATQAEQSINKRNNRMVTFNGETMCLRDWAQRIGLDSSTLHARLSHGWPVEFALTIERYKHVPKSQRSNQMTRKHWYRLHIGECPVCGSEQSYRVRVYGRKPKRPEARIVYLSHSETYDQCMEQG